MKIEREFEGYDGVFATRLRELMETTETTQAILAKQTGLTRQAISKYMDGSVSPTVEKFRRICSYFEIPSDYLLGFTDAKSKDMTNQHIQDKIGLSKEAIKNLEEINRERFRGLFTLPDQIFSIDIINYILSSQNIILILKHIFNYFSEKLEDNRTAKKTGKFESSKETGLANYLLTGLTQELYDDCYNALYIPLLEDKKEKQKPGRKRKEDVTHSNSTED